LNDLTRKSVELDRKDPSSIYMGIIN